MRDADAIAEIVVSSMKVALAPVAASLARAEERLATLEASADLGELRERVEKVETRALGDDALAPITTRLTELDAVLARVPEELALKLLTERTATAELVTSSVVETRRIVEASIAEALAKEAFAHRLAELDRTIAAVRSDLALALEKECGTLRERLGIVETRAPVPGPRGADGRDGINGKDGADGLGFDDLSVEYDGERTLAFAFTRGELRKTFPVTLPMLRYQGVYQHGYAYVIGDVVTDAGAAWHCQKPTTLRPSEGSAAWRLMVKKGRDGRDLRESVRA